MSAPAMGDDDWGPDGYPGGWFGVSWGAPVCGEESHKPTPVGQPCTECTVLIVEGDRGMLIPGAGLAEDGETIVYGVWAHHLACFLDGLGVDR